MKYKTYLLQQITDKIKSMLFVFPTIVTQFCNFILPVIVTVTWQSEATYFTSAS